MQADSLLESENFQKTWNLLFYPPCFEIDPRFSGEKEYEISQHTNLFTNAILQEEEITEQEYYDF